MGKTSGGCATKDTYTRGWGGAGAPAWRREAAAFEMGERGIGFPVEKESTHVAAGEERGAWGAGRTGVDVLDGDLEPVEGARL
jgi:hypothetical protein